MGYAIKTTNLVKRYKDKTAVDGLTLTVEEGELIALSVGNDRGIRKHTALWCHWCDFRAVSIYL